MNSMMASVFHWIRIKAICNATEDEDLIFETMMDLTGLGEDDLIVDISEGQHGNPIIVIDAEMKHNKECISLFCQLGEHIVEELLSQLNERTDDDCVFFIRLSKQQAVQKKYVTAHGGDVISITGKIVSHPARKEIAVKNAEVFLREILERLQASSQLPEPS